LSECETRVDAATKRRPRVSLSLNPGYNIDAIDPAVAIMPFGSYVITIGLAGKKNLDPGHG
jgi:hypothetical protein